MILLRKPKQCANLIHTHDNRYYTESEVDSLLATISGGSGTTDHSSLNNLDYSSSGHTGFQPAGDYLTDLEFTTYSGTLQSQIDSKSDLGHTHDDRYYTEFESDGLFTTLSGSLQSEIDSKSDSSHTHDDRYYTESEVDILIATASGVSEHSSLSGLFNDDHPQYFLSNCSKEVSGNILPEMTAASGVVSVRDIGSSSQKFRNLYVHDAFLDAGSLYVNGKKVIEDVSDTIYVSTDPDQNLVVRTTGNGTLRFESDNGMELQSDDEVKIDATGGIDIDVPSNIPNKNISFTNSSTTGNISFSSIGVGGDIQFIASDDIEFFGSGAEFNCGLSVSGSVLVSGIDHALSDTNKFIVSDAGVLKYRTGSEIRSDIGSASSIHTHDDRYYTEFESDGLFTTLSGSLQSEIDSKSDLGHTHDDRYYTEFESDGLFTTLSGSLQSEIDSKSDLGHTHDDRYYTETELNNGQLDDRYYTESEVNFLLATVSGTGISNLDGGCAGSVYNSVDSSPIDGGGANSF